MGEMLGLKIYDNIRENVGYCWINLEKSVFQPKNSAKWLAKVAIKTET